MPIFTENLPLGLYVHLPWCVRKCPYCDFNSHTASIIPETHYIKALLEDLDEHLPYVQNRAVKSIFFGGGTPSLFSAPAIESILEGIKKRIALAADIEITLEANPGTVDQSHFDGFRAAGVNRLSIGIQSFQNEKLKILGRIHDTSQAFKAIEIAKNAGFSNFNLDLMYGLPNQSVEDALFDLQTALTFKSTHLSWYQLTIEPNTLFYHQTPKLPDEDLIWNMQEAGQTLLANSKFRQYEVSDFALADFECQHNLNYWQFGDYLGIGAGAHSKITHDQKILRWAQVKHPRDYLDATKRLNCIKREVLTNDIIFEFMLNALRLTDGIPMALFIERTGISINEIQYKLNAATSRGLLAKHPSHLFADRFRQKVFE